MKYFHGNLLSSSISPSLLDIKVSEHAPALCCTCKAYSPQEFFLGCVVRFRFRQGMPRQESARENVSEVQPQYHAFLHDSQLSSDLNMMLALSFPAPMTEGVDSQDGGSYTSTYISANLNYFLLARTLFWPSSLANAADEPRGLRKVSLRLYDTSSSWSSSIVTLLTDPFQSTSRGLVGTRYGVDGLREAVTKPFLVPSPRYLA
jgi:hypothetical protein